MGSDAALKYLKYGENSRSRAPKTETETETKTEANVIEALTYAGEQLNKWNVVGLRVWVIHGIGTHPRARFLNQ